MASSHSWEDGGAARRHSWESDTESDSDRKSDSEVDDTPTNAGDEFVAHAAGLLHNRVLNAKQFCIQMYWAGKAGVLEAVAFGLPPDRPSGHYQRHLKSAMPHVFDDSVLYDFEMPCHGKHDLSRSVRTCWATLPYEEIALDMAKPTFRTRLEERLRDMPPVYWEHPLVRASGDQERVAPLALYLDGVPYSQTDSVIGYWLICMVTGKRYMAAVLRKRQMCQCGCRGWCSHHAVFLFLKWVLQVLAEAVFPSSRHDGPWRPRDSERSLMGGSTLAYKCCVVHVKGDWAEYAATLGFPTWQDSLRPCFECAAFGPDMFECVGHSVASLHWTCNSDDDYERACVRCEIRLDLDAIAKATVLALLRPDKRKDGSHGLALTCDIPTLGLLANDRLEPCPTLQDAHALADAPVPVAVVFWRVSNETLTRHRNPLFCDEIGLSPKRSLTVDMLHANNLGVMNIWCRVVLWFLLLSGIYGAVGTAEENMLAAVLALRYDLMQFYKDNKALNLTAVSDLTVKMLGTSNDRKCKTKGAETWGVMLFLLSVLAGRGAHLGEDAARYLAAGSALRQVVEKWNSHGATVPRAAQQDSGVDLYTNKKTKNADAVYIAI